MAAIIQLLQLSPTMTTGRVVKWLVKEGQAVKSGTVLAEIETDKAVMEQESFDAGTVRKLLVAEGGSVEVGGGLAILGKADEDISSLLNGAPKAPPAAPASKAAPAPPPATPAPVAAPPAATAPEKSAAAAPAAPTAAQPKPAAGGRQFSSPLARKIAAESGVDVAGIAGSGPGGRVIRRDVEAALQHGTAAKAIGAASISAADEEVPLSQMRRVIARRLLESRQQIPSFNLGIQVNAERLLAAIARIKEAAPDAKVTMTHFLIRATASVVMRHPWMRTQWVNEKLIRKHSAHISVAVAIEDGLLTPVIRDAQTKGVIQIATELRDLAAKARARKLSGEDLSGGVQTISNLGMFGISQFDAIINPPEATILAIGAVEERHAALPNGQWGPVPFFSITMGCDHRVVDGAVGAQYLKDLKAALEEPTLMLL